MILCFERERLFILLLFCVFFLYNYIFYDMKEKKIFVKKKKSSTYEKKSTHFFLIFFFSYLYTFIFFHLLIHKKHTHLSIISQWKAPSFSSQNHTSHRH